VKKKQKQRYRVRNWREYNAALVSRGSLTVWLDEAVLSGCEVLQKREEEQGQPLKVTIPPRRGARIWQHGNSKDQRLARDENLREIRQKGRKRWKQESGYHRRSLAETAMSRYKRIVGEKLQARDFQRQSTEAFVGVLILNKMTALGMPRSYARSYAI